MREDMLEPLRFQERIFLSDFVLAPIDVIWRQFLIWRDVSQKWQPNVLYVRNESSLIFYIRNSFQIFIKSKIEQLWGCERQSYPMIATKWHVYHYFSKTHSPFFLK